MTLSRTRGVPYGVGEEILSAELSAIDAQIEGALDKRAGQTDTLESVVQCSNPGRIIETVVSGADADTTYQAAQARNIRLTTAILADRIYTLSNTGAAAGDTITIFSEVGFGYNVNVKDNGGTSLLILGNGGTADAKWATFLHTGTGWVVMAAGVRGAPSQYILSTGAGDISGSYTVPAGCYYVEIQCLGGGGGGGGGTGPNAALVNGGGGGGGATLGKFIVSVSPGDTLNATAGGGGAGAVGNTSGSSASFGDSGNPSFVTLSGNQVAYSPGAMGGTGPLYTGGAAWHAAGGRSVRGVVAVLGIGYGNAAATATAPSTHADFPLPGQGGWGTQDAVGRGFRYGGSQAGLGGSPGATDTVNGRAGGGGGASGWPGNVPGTGGNGWSGAGATPAGTAGTLGAGGGGGGGNGSAAGGAGGNGGQGLVVITPLY